MSSSSLFIVHVSPVGLKRALISSSDKTAMMSKVLSTEHRNMFCGYLKEKKNVVLINIFDHTAKHLPTN